MQITVQLLSQCPQHQDAVLAGLQNQWPGIYVPDEPTQNTWVLLNGDIPLGSVSVLPEENPPETPELWVAFLWVHPDHRRQGLATLLLKEVVRGEPHRPLFLWTETKILHGTLLNLGWVQVEDYPERQVYTRV